MKRTVAFFAGLVVLVFGPAAALADGQGTWIGTWASSPTGVPTTEKIGSYTIPAPFVVKGTFRYRLRISEGGSQIRIRLSNEYGKTPLVVAAVTVGIAANGLDVRIASLKKATFGGKAETVIPAGAPLLSDPVNLSVKSLSDLIVSIYVPEGLSVYVWSDKISPIDPGFVQGVDATLTEKFPSEKRMPVRPVVSAISALTQHPSEVVVALGDSITDGGVDPTTGDRGWPGVLSRRLQGKSISVVNAGISGNRLLGSLDFVGRSALSRLEQDVFSIPGVRQVIVLEGINDVGVSGPGGMLGDSQLVRAEDLIGAYSQLIARSHERGVKVIGATILPFEGSNYYSEDRERVRSSTNEWIRTSGAFDGVIDFDAALRDPAEFGRLKAEYDSGDHLHPNPTGYRHMAEAVDIKLFN